MNIDRIKEMVEIDLKMDGTELADESVRIPQLHGKYLNIFHDENLIFKKYNTDYKVLLRLKWEYYGGKLSEDEIKALGWSPFEHRILRQDLDIYLESDADLLKIQSKIELQKQKVEYLESIMKGINNRQWIIRCAIDWRKFVSGVT